MTVTSKRGEGGDMKWPEEDIFGWMIRDLISGICTASQQIIFQHLWEQVGILSNLLSQNDPSVLKQLCCYTVLNHLVVSDSLQPHEL